MKKITIAMMIAVIVSLLGCEAKRVPVRIIPDRQLFSRAESMFQKKAYDESLAAFEEYLSKFPESPLAANRFPSSIVSVVL